MWQDHVGKQLAKLGPNGMEVQETTEADIEEAEEARTCCMFEFLSGSEGFDFVVMLLVDQVRKS